MSLTTGIAIYFIIWWTVLFAVLPWGVRSQAESGVVARGTDPGAPAAPKVWLKLACTTVAATVIFILCAAAYRYRMVTIDGLAHFFGMAR